MSGAINCKGVEILEYFAEAEVSEALDLDRPVSKGGERNALDDALGNCVLLPMDCPNGKLAIICVVHLLVGTVLR